VSKRSLLILALPCICCEMEDLTQPNRTSEHHLNLGGKAGQKRRGDAFSIPLCLWHHQGESINDYTSGEMHWRWGPSLARESKAFRERYGNDDLLLELTNGRLE
jgi:hypothetical protein